MVLALTLRSFTSTLLPHRTMGMFSQTRTKSPGIQMSAKYDTRNYNPMSLTVPVGNVLVGDSGGHVEHDDTALTVDVVAITQATELLLASSIPDVEGDVTEVLVMVRGFALGRAVAKSRGRG